MLKEIKFKLPSGDMMPLLGFGTFSIRGPEQTTKVLDYALSAGYRLFDTAAMYGNEDDIGQALKELLPNHNLTRRDIFITTKLYPDDHGEKAYKAMEISLNKLDCDYLDLFLIHWPGAYGVGSSSKENAILRDKSWQQMVKGVKNGLTRNIGVSNYNKKHLEQLIDNDHGIKPAVNQMEWHPFCHQSELYDFCKREGVLLQAYSSLGGTGNTDLLKKKEVRVIARKLRKTPAQVLLRWSLQQNIAIIPKSRTKVHIESNFDLDFTIPEKDMKILSSFTYQARYDWDPDMIA